MLAETFCGHKDFKNIGDKLFLELKIHGMLRNEAERNALQIRFLEAHCYFTPTAFAKRKPAKGLHLARLKAGISETFYST